LRFEMTQIYWHFVDVLWIFNRFPMVTTAIIRNHFNF